MIVQEMTTDSIPQVLSDSSTIFKEYLSSKLRSISNLCIDIRLGESSTVSPLLALSYIFSPPTWYRDQL